MKNWLQLFSQLARPGKRFAACLLLMSLTAHGEAGEWIAAPSYFTHDPQSGMRVRQFAPIGPFYVQSRGDYRRSGYRQTRSSIQAGGSSDNLHIVEEWGRPIRPYGEWRFPYRPHSVPYHLWGPPFGGLPQRGVRGRFNDSRYAVPPGGNGGAGPANPRDFQAYPGYHPTPWQDGRYAPYDSRGPYAHPDLLLRQRGRFDLPMNDNED